MFNWLRNFNSKVLAHRQTRDLQSLQNNFSDTVQFVSLMFQLAFVLLILINVYTQKPLLFFCEVSQKLYLLNVLR